MPETNTTTDITNIIKKLYNIDDLYTTHQSYMSKYKNILYSESGRSEEVTIFKPYKADNGEIEYEQKKEPRPIKKINAILQACKEFASLMFNEDIDFKVDIEGDKKYTKEIDYLNKFYIEKNLWSRLEDCIVDVLGTGCVSVVANYDNRWGTQITFYDGCNVIPITIKDNEIKECIFIGKDIYDSNKIYLSVHRIEWGKKTELINEQLLVSEQPIGYIIDNLTIKDGKVIENESITGIRSPERLFAIFKPFNRNSQKYSTAFGVPIWLDFKDIADNIDDTFHISTKDVKITQAVLLASLELFKDEKGNIQPPAWWSEFANIIMVSDPSKYSADGKSNEILQLESLPTKITAYTQHISELLKMYSNGVGLGSEGLTINKLSTPTATQVISDNAQKFTNLKKHFSQIREEISVLNKAILFLANLNERQSYELVPITFNTQDNVITDDETQRQIALEEVNAGVMSIPRYVMEFSGLSGEELIKELDRLGYDENGNKKDSLIDSMGLYNVDNKDNNQSDNLQNNQKNNLKGEDNEKGNNSQNTDTAKQ